jgi:hypothetical protein
VVPLSLLPKVPFQPRFRLGLGLGLGLDYGAPPFLILTLIRPNRSHLLAYRDIVITSLLLTSLCLAAFMGTSAIASFPSAALIGSGVGAVAVAARLRPVPRPPPRWRDKRWLRPRQPPRIYTVVAALQAPFCRPGNMRLCSAPRRPSQSRHSCRSPSRSPACTVIYYSVHRCVSSDEMRFGWALFPASVTVRSGRREKEKAGAFPPPLPQPAAPAVAAFLAHLRVHRPRFVG